MAEQETTNINLEKIKYRIEEGLKLINLPIESFVCFIFSGFYFDSDTAAEDKLMKLTAVAENSEILNTNFPLWIGVYKNRESASIRLEVIIPIEVEKIETKLSEKFLYHFDNILDTSSTNLSIDINCTDTSKFNEVILEAIKSLMVEVSRINNLYVEIQKTEEVE